MGSYKHIMLNVNYYCRLVTHSFPAFKVCQTSWSSPFLSLLVGFVFAVTLLGDANDGGVMHQAINSGDCHHVIREYISPFIKRLV
jgi:hypothetical protein